MMDTDPPISKLCLQRGTQVNLDPSAPYSIVHLQFPSSGTLNRHSRATRRVTSTLPSSRSEDDFRRQHVASASSIYFRKSRVFPRSILWRVLDGGTILELRSVDLSKESSEKKEAPLILRFQFPSAIHSNGVALAGGDEDALSVFVATKGNELYTLSLRSTFFCHLNASGEDSDRWCNICQNHYWFASGTFHGMTAAGTSELILSLTDGSMARLLWQQGKDGLGWYGTTYGDLDWKTSLRSMVSFQRSSKDWLRIDGISFRRTAAVSGLLSPDRRHIVTVCLDHTLRFWSVATVQMTATRDLLGVERTAEEAEKMGINLNTPKLLEVFKARTTGSADVYYAMTYSPYSNGVFKVWAVRDADYSDHGVRDLFAEDVLRPPDPDDGALWTMFDFRVRTTAGSDGIDIWILMRLNRRCRLYFRQFPDFQSLGVDWKTGWSVTNIDGNPPALNDPPTQYNPLDPRSVSDKWLEFLWTPGWIPESVFETALRAYASSQQIDPSGQQQTLRERVASCVGSIVALRPSDSDLEPLEQFNQDLNSEWLNFWQCVLEIENSRTEPMSLGVDELNDMAWVVLADSACLVRDCSDVETLALNSPDVLLGYQNDAILPSVEADDSRSPSISQEQRAALIVIAASFRSSFSPALTHACQDMVDSELWQEPSLSATEQVQAFYEQCDFSVEIGDDDYEDFEDSLEAAGGIDAITTPLFLSVIESISNKMSKGSSLASTNFGLKAVVRGTQDMVSAHSRVLQDLLYLAVFIERDTDQEQHPLLDFDAATIYTNIIEQLRPLEMARWLASTTRQESEASQAPEPKSHSTSARSSTPRTSTVIENLFARDIRPPSLEGRQSQSAALTQTIRDTLTWMAGGGEITLENVLVNIQCGFLKNNNVDLATMFDHFQPATAWATYIRGRLRLLQGDYAEAAIYFNEAAPKLCMYAIPQRLILFLT